jgi:pyrroline-5-carboxylate reductase
MKHQIAILGGGNIGVSLGVGLVEAGYEDVVITKRNIANLQGKISDKIQILSDNIAAIKQSKIIIIAVLPQQLNQLMNKISEHINPNHHLLISVVSGVSIKDIESFTKAPIIRAMPNTAIAIKQSMTCLAATTHSAEYLPLAKDIFHSVGEVLVIKEENMTAATALCACGLAFFLRSIRAASQGGIQIGFHSEEALQMAAQTALGAASLILKNGSHPEHEIDKVTSPEGCTIAGLNEMEHQGFSSAMIKGILTASIKADKLYH